MAKAIVTRRFNATDVKKGVSRLIEPSDKPQTLPAWIVEAGIKAGAVQADDAAEKPAGKRPTTTKSAAAKQAVDPAEADAVTPPKSSRAPVTRHTAESAAASAIRHAAASGASVAQTTTTPSAAGAAEQKGD